VTVGVEVESCVYISEQFVLFLYKFSVFDKGVTVGVDEVERCVYGSYSTI
jgi:hypothetical protein